jgi:hypothetical protein
MVLRAKNAMYLPSVHVNPLGRGEPPGAVRTLVEAFLDMKAYWIRMKSVGILAQHSRNVSVPLLRFTNHLLLKEVSDTSTSNTAFPTSHIPLPMVNEVGQISCN